MIQDADNVARMAASGSEAVGGTPAALAALLKTETELVLKSRRVAPGRLLNDGFAFQFPNWDEAGRDLCTRWGHREPAVE